MHCAGRESDDTGALHASNPLDRRIEQSGPIKAALQSPSRSNNPQSVFVNIKSLNSFDHTNFYRNQ